MKTTQHTDSQRLEAEYVLNAHRTRQALGEDRIHDWYRFVLAFPDHLVREMCERFAVADSDTVLDPFCGTGTTLVECKKLGIKSVGIEANPACVFASRVKTRWDIDLTVLRELGTHVLQETAQVREDLSLAITPLFSSQYQDLDQVKERLLSQSSAGQYLVASGMVERGWISEVPFYKSLALHNVICALDVDPTLKDALLLALVAIIVEGAANVSFGPELYVSKEKVDADVGALFRRKIEKMVNDLQAVQGLATGKARVFEGDARECASLLREEGIDRVDYVITSPPYPTEKDYTRQTRLEMVYLGFVKDRETLQTVKKAMIRSHSKGIYKTDDDGRFVAHIPEVQAIADELRKKVAHKTYGFAKLYPRIIEEYFGGMYRHLRSLSSILRSGGVCAYVVGDQRTYLRTYTPTGKILGIIAEQNEIGLKHEDSLVWRVRRGTTGDGKEIKEEIVIFKKP